MNDFELFEMVEVYHLFYTYDFADENLYKSYYEKLQLFKSVFKVSHFEEYHLLMLTWWFPSFGLDKFDPPIMITRCHFFIP